MLLMKDKQDKTIKSVNSIPVWTQQKRDAKGRFLSILGTKPEHKIYTESDLAKAFLSGTKQSREIIETVRPDPDTLKHAYLSGMNASKSGLRTPTQQFESWARNEGLL